MFARSFKELMVYQKARGVSSEIFTLSKLFPREETYSLTDQIRRSSRSIGAQIAEAWAKRRYEKHFVSKLTDADGEQMETQHWLDESTHCGYLSAEKSSLLPSELESIGRMLNQMILKSELFCQDDSRMAREESAVYGDMDDFFIPTTGHWSPVTGH
ncbi:MAG TPA: four helix bundle protein [Kiritimatiellia bacterium]|nr:four helix bundle protein [Kiritimatiellia bacterium]